MILNKLNVLDRINQKFPVKNEKPEGSDIFLGFMITVLGVLLATIIIMAIVSLILALLDNVLLTSVAILGGIVGLYILVKSARFIARRMS